MHTDSVMNNANLKIKLINCLEYLHLLCLQEEDSSWRVSYRLVFSLSLYKKNYMIFNKTFIFQIPYSPTGPEE